MILTAFEAVVEKDKKAVPAVKLVMTGAMKNNVE